MSSKTRVAVIGADAATFDVIQPLFARNKLPVLHRLVNQGVHGELMSTVPPITACAWPSIVTGKNPGKHGLYDFVTRKRGTYEETLATSKNRRCEALWNILSRHGRHVIVVNVPLTYPPEEVLGCMISGIGSPNNSPSIAFPKEIYEEVRRSCGGYRVMYDVEPTDRNCEAFLADVKNLIQTRGEAVRYLMDRIDWDFLMVVFQSTDWVQHFLWRFMDESHPAFKSDASESLRNGISVVYEALDLEIGKILRKTSNGDYVFVVSDHGMGPLFKSVYMNNWLVNQGYLKYKRNIRYLAHRMGMTSENLYKLVVRLHATGVIPRLRGRKETLIHLFLSMKDVDWSKTKAYSIGLDGNIRLNVVGREPSGVVSTGNEYLRVITELRSKLELFSDPETGERIADNVFSRDQIFSGPYLDEAPDLVLVLTRYHQDYRYGSNSIVGPPPDRNSGNHRSAGILIASGPGIKKGQRIARHSVVDVAPTVLEILGVPLPEDLDGQAMGEIFTKTLQRDTIKQAATEHPAVSEQPGGVYTTEEEEKVKERLRALGYL